MKDPQVPELASPAPKAKRFGSPLVLGGLGLALVLALAYAQNLRHLTGIWLNDPDYSHGILVLPMALVILWRLWPEPAALRLRPSPWGLGLLVLILGARAWLYQQGEYWLETATIVPAVGALIWTVWGGATLRRLWPAVAFLIFMLPVPGAFDSRLSLPLQGLAARGSCTILRLLGFWVINQGNLILVGSEQLEVARACSGLAMLVSLAATVSAASLLIPMEWWKRLVLLASIVPIALLCNMIRIMATAWAYQFFGGEAGRSFAHDMAGWLMMPLAMVLVGLELAWMSRLLTTEPAADGPTETGFDPRSPQLVMVPARSSRPEGRV